ncbi:hypothetical protein COU57_00125 [Candidatus Pacearchaeota archaeon CG10_big_fil_rev_8_21_14_0_10_32_14]|nr:MAG: hypothetical protein COU57_00125 [Candidatus Pacearchaeota archaeon CG10_big_fil_rev_8_21_14_0_10_32_14]
MVYRYDVIVVGCGAAGISAAVYLSRAKIKTLVVGKKDESQMNEAGTIENYFGLEKVSYGKKILNVEYKKAKKYGSEFKECKVDNVKKVSDYYEIHCDSNMTYYSRYVIIATGVVIPQTIVKSLNLKLDGKIFLVDRKNATTTEKVYAVGNCCSMNKQLAHAVGDGCNAAIDIIRKELKKDLYVDYSVLEGT